MAMSYTMLAFLMIFASILNISSGFYKEQAVENANCKNGASLYLEPASFIAGCYKYFNVPKTLIDAELSCANCSTGFCGQLVAVRTQGEFQFLGALARYTNKLVDPVVYVPQRYWTTGRSSDKGVWTWSTYSRSIRFLDTWITEGLTSESSQVAITASGFKNSFILAGKATPYDWDFMTLDDSRKEYGYICRKDACSPQSEVLNGICSTLSTELSNDQKSDASSTSEASSSWIAAPIILGVVIIVILLLMYLKFKKNDTYIRLKKRIASVRSIKDFSEKDAIRMIALVEENETLRSKLASLNEGISVPRMATPLTSNTLPKLNNPINAIPKSSLNVLDASPNASNLEEGNLSPSSKSVLDIPRPTSKAAPIPGFAKSAAILPRPTIVSVRNSTVPVSNPFQRTLAKTDDVSTDNTSSKKDSTQDL